MEIREDDEIRDERNDEEKSEEAKEELKKSEEHGTFYYEDGEICGCYASCMKQRSPTPTNPSYSPSVPTYDEWVKMSKGGRRMWEENGYTAYNGKVEMDPRSPKCWAINQPGYDDEEEPLYAPSSPSYNVREERGIHVFSSGFRGAL